MTVPAGEIVNKVAQSGLVTLDLADYADARPRSVIDLKDRLFMGQILRERDLREWAAAHDWSQYAGHNVLITCSADAVIPGWAWMLPVIFLQPFAANIVSGSMEDLDRVLFMKALDTINFDTFQDKKVVVKGCGDVPIPTSAFVELTARLRAVAAKIMYGEPCSTVPLFKKEK